MKNGRQARDTTRNAGLFIGAYFPSERSMLNAR